MHINATTNIEYTGQNPEILEGAMIENGFSKAEWLTYKQAQAIGGQVRKGESGTTLVRVVLITDKKTKTKKKMPKKFTVFNVEQCDWS